MNKGTIGFAGLSHLGIVSSIAAASKGFDVVCFDSRTDLCKNLVDGKFPISEPQLEELFMENRKALGFTNDPQALNRCELIYFSLDITTDGENQSDLSGLKKLIREVLPHISQGTTLVILSQVKPGFTRQMVAEIQKKAQLYYQVETLIFGQAVQRALFPERTIVGCANPHEPLPAAYENFLKVHNCPILKMRYESAELAKISINLFLAASLSTTNMLAEICEGLGADWSEIVPALKLDKRIGPHAYLTPGLGIAGGNIERDLVTIKNLAAETGSEASVASAFLLQSAYRRDWTVRTIHRQVLSQKKGARLAVWGLAYKANTHSIKNSPSLALLESLSEIEVSLYDPQAVLENKNPKITQVDSAMKACEGADALIIMTPWEEFQTITPAAVREALREPTVIDPWGVWRGKELKGIRYSTLGVSQI